MTSLFFGHLSNTPVPADENVVRMTTSVVQMDAPAAEQEHAPEFNEYESDPNPTLGLATRTLASKWTQGEKQEPEWKERVDDGYLHNALIDRQISTSGHAAALEAEGRWGHGTLSYAEGIEPVHDLDGGRFGNEYFEANSQGANESAGNYMTPLGDQATTAKVAVVAKSAEREAAQAALITKWYSSMMGG